MLSLRDWTARARRLARGVVAKIEESRPRPAPARRPAIGSDDPVPATVSLQALPEVLHRDAEKLEKVDPRYRPAVVGAQVLASTGVPIEDLRPALGSEGGWLGATMAVLELGRRNGSWAALAESDGAEAACVRQELELLGPKAMLALGIAEFIRVEGGPAAGEVLLEVNRWQKSRRPAKQAAARVAPPQSVAEEAPAPIAKPAPGTADTAPPTPPRGAGTDPDLSRLMRKNIASEELLRALLEFNVNQCRGPNPEGWYVAGNEPELFLLRSKVAAQLKAKLKAQGLLKEMCHGQPSTAGGTFWIQPGERKYDAFAVDLEVLESITAGSKQRLADRFDATRNASASSWTVKVLPTPPEKQGEATAKAPGEYECPRCKAGPLKAKEGKDGRFFVCDAESRCGFSVQANDQGEPLGPKPCPDCGNPTYLSRKRKLRYKHLAAGPCPASTAKAA